MYNPRMATAGQVRKLTYDDLLAMPDDGLRHEIIAGVLYVSPSPGTPHQFTVGKLHQALANFLDDHPVGEVYLAPFDVVFTKYDVVEPDLLFVRTERLSVITEKNVTGTPDLAIEVLSPSTRRLDLTLKRDLFEREGVGEYWVVDPVAGTVEVHRRVQSRLVPVGMLASTGDDALTSPLLPGFTVPLKKLFRAPRS
jgi:Uma2 family endonuclease